MAKTKDQKSEQQKEKAERWSFPTVSACPRCRGTNTIAVSTQKNIQYRICRAPVCRNRYTVIGTKVHK